MALPAFRSAGAAAGGIGAITPGLPSGQAANDILLLYCESANEAVIAPTGYVEVTGSPQFTGIAASTTATRLTVFWKRSVGALEVAPLIADVGDHVYAQVLAFSGCPTTGNPWDITAGDTASAATGVTIPGVTTTVTDCLIVAAVANGTDTSTAQTSAWANANLASPAMAELTGADGNSTAGNGGGFGVGAGGLATGGASGATTATLATSSVQGRLTIALKSTTSVALGGSVDPMGQHGFFGI